MSYGLQAVLWVAGYTIAGLATRYLINRGEP